MLPPLNLELTRMASLENQLVPGPSTLGSGNLSVGPHAYTADV